MEKPDLRQAVMGQCQLLLGLTLLKGELGSESCRFLSCEERSEIRASKTVLFKSLKCPFSTH